MTVRRLNIDDVDDLRLFVNSRRTVRDLFDEQTSILIEYQEKWLEGMKRYYLTGTDTHYLYGSFNDGQLLSCMGWRCDLQHPWDDGWVVGHLKTRPGQGLVKTGMVDLWRAMFEICESKGLQRWHMLIPESNRSGYQAIADRFFKDIDSTYDYEWSVIVPPRTKPDIDWIWGTMGRTFHEKEIRVRTGIKK